MGKRDFCRVRETDGGLVDKYEANASAGAVGEQSVLVGGSGVARNCEGRIGDRWEAGCGSRVGDVERRRGRTAGGADKPEGAGGTVRAEYFGAGAASGGRFDSAR